MDSTPIVYANRLSDIHLPEPAELIRRINDCREELAALKNLLRLTRAALRAAEARERRAQAGSINSKQGP